MLFAHAFDRPNLLSGIRRFRKNPIHVYGSALGLVAAATLIRLGLHQELSSASPFTAYSLATLCMALAGGFYPGMVTLAASLVAGASAIAESRSTITESITSVRGSRGLYKVESVCSAPVVRYRLYAQEAALPCVA